jgi:hypothetical protein
LYTKKDPYFVIETCVDFQHEVAPGWVESPVSSKHNDAVLIAEGAVGCKPLIQPGAPVEQYPVPPGEAEGI